MQPEPWMNRAECLTHDPDMWFSDDQQEQREAKRICDTCHVAAECELFAQRNGDEYGIWGGVESRRRRNDRVDVTAEVEPMGDTRRIRNYLNPFDALM